MRLAGAALAFKLVFAAAALAETRAARDECPCGYVGENCTDIGYTDPAGLPVVNPDLKVPQGECVHYSSCETDLGAGVVSCKCWEAYTGELCDQPLKPLVWNLLVMGLFVPAVFSIGSLILLRRHHKSTDSPRYFSIARKATTQGVGSKMQLFVYRALIAGFLLLVELAGFVYFIVLKNPMPDDTEVDFLTLIKALLFFTITNALMLQVYFTIGTYLSARAIWFETEEQGELPLSTVHKVFYVIMQIETSTTILIATIFWLVLFPYAVHEQGLPLSMLLSPFSIVFHGLNVFIMGFDFWLNGLYFVKHHFYYMLVWAGLYFFLHNFVMLIEFAEGLPHRPSYFFISSASPYLVLWIMVIVTLMGIFFMATFYLSHYVKPGQPVYISSMSKSTANGSEPQSPMQEATANSSHGSIITKQPSLEP